MKKNTKFIGIGLGFFIVLAILVAIINYIAENRMKQALEESLSRNNFDYTELHISILNRKIDIEKPQYNFESKSFSAERVSLVDIEILNYLFSKNIEIGELLIEHPLLKINKAKSDETQKKEDDKKSSKELDENIFIKKLTIRKGDVVVSENESTETSLYGKFTRLQLYDFRLNKETLKQPLAFSYEAYSFQGDSLFYKLDSRHHLTAGKINIQNGVTTINNIRIIPLYGKQEFQQHIPHELDRFDLKKIEKIDFSNIQWEIKNDSLYLHNTFTQINGVHLEIYRDKLQKTDIRRKKMYSQMIRELPIKLKLDTLCLHNMYIRYEENVAVDREPGVVDFKNLSASIYNLSNIGMDKPDFPETEIDVQTDFMNEAPVEVHWVFDISDRNDAFKISGQMGLLSAQAMNRMLQPAMNVKANGNIDDMVFNYAGNKNKAKGDLSLFYNNFKVEVLRKNGSKKSNVLSAIANLIINNGLKSKNVEQQGLEVNRKTNRSFWNYLWLMVREGALKSFI